MSADGLDPRHIEDVLARELKDATARLHVDAALVLLRTRRDHHFLLRAPVGLGAPLLLDVAEVVSTRPAELAALYARSGFAASAVLPLEVGGVEAGELHLLAKAGRLAASDPALVAAARALGPLAFSLRGLEATRAAEERRDLSEQIARGLLQHLELETLFPEIIRLLARLCPCDAASIAVPRADEDVMELVTVYGPSLSDEIRPGSKIRMGDTRITEAWRTGRIVAEPDGRVSAYARTRTLAATGILASLYIPVGEPCRAVLCVGHRLPHAFGDEETALYRSIVPFIEIALRNAELVGKIRESYRALDAALERLVRTERLRALGELAAGVAHDVGNVLAIVGSHAELVAQKATDPESRALAEACVRSVKDGSRAVQHVLDVARGAAPIEKATERFELERVAREAALLAAGRAREAGQTLDEAGLLAVPSAPGVPGEVREALLNLIFNAIDATPRGGRIELATRPEDDRIVFSVEDTGPGVPSELRERVFEAFFTTKGPGHVGLGLAQVARVARSLGGTVRVVESTTGGARFELRLPVQDLGSGPHELPRVKGAARPARSVQVLLVEDEVALRTALAALLQLRGHAVATAPDVDGALAALASRPSIEVVVTDLGLPGRSGWELVDELRARRPDLPVVVLSGLGALTDPEQARERGVAAVLAKPTSEQDLAATIEHLVH